MLVNLIIVKNIVKFFVYYTNILYSSYNQFFPLDTTKWGKVQRQFFPYAIIKKIKENKYKSYYYYFEINFYLYILYTYFFIYIIYF